MWHSVDEHIGYALVEYTAGNTVFREYEKRQFECVQDAGFEVIPRGRKGHCGMYGLLVLSSPL